MQLTEILTNKQTQLTDQFYRKNSNRKFSNIETVAVTYTHENLPDWLEPYMQNIPLRKYYANLLNKGFEKELFYFVKHKMTESVEKPFNYINKSWGRKRFEQTIELLRKEIAAIPVIQEVCKRIQATNKQLNAVRSIVWRWGSVAIRHAVCAEEKGRDKFKYFCWLTSRKGQEVMNAPGN